MNLNSPAKLSGMAFMPPLMPPLKSIKQARQQAQPLKSERI